MSTTTNKQLIDMGWGTAITASFAIPGVGPGVAAVLAGGKLAFDLFYTPVQQVDPLAQLPTKADLKNAITGLETDIQSYIWANTKSLKADDVITSINELNKRVRDAGAKPAPHPITHADGTPDTQVMPMAGDTTVWINGVVDILFDPIEKNPPDYLDIANLIEAKVSMKFRSVGLYTTTVSAFLNMCKTAMVWEINNNLKAYINAYNAWDDAHQSWLMDKQSYPDPGPEPAQPTDGAPAVGSETQTGQGGLIDYRSYLGMKKGYNISAFAQKAKDEMQGREAHLAKIIADWAQAKTDRKAYVDGLLDQVVTLVHDGGLNYHWSNSDTGQSGDPVPKPLAEMQAQAERAKLVGKYEKQWNASNSNPDDLDDHDIARLKDTLALWKSTVAELKKIDETTKP